ncbi:MAG TPA: DAHL domain-containing protein [Casimicrobiaceae bacterium]|jgi:signal transduction histidine kinase
MSIARLLRVIAVIGAVAALCGGLIFLYTKTSSVDAEKKAQVEGYLRQLKQLDAEWNVDVLKSRMEINKNYDPLTSPLSKLTELQERLGDGVRTLNQTDTEKALGELKGVIAEKVDLVDQFKAQNAILKNSLRYVPTAVDDLRAEIRASRRTAQGISERLDILDARASQLLNDVLKYNLLPDAAAADSIEASLNAMESANRAYPEDIAASVRNLVIHTRIVLRQRLVEGEILTKLSAAPMTRAIDQLGEVFDRDFHATLAESDRYRQYLLAYSSVLLALLVYIGARLVRSYRIIGRVNKDLKHANETLEQRVRERTEELSKALHNLKESETHLVQSEKMASLGQMVAGVAHEINTPLAYVRSSLETVESQLSGMVREFVDAMVALIASMRSGDATDDEIAEKFSVASSLTDNLGEFAVMDEIQGLLKDGVHGVDEISKIVVGLKNFSRLDRSRIAKCTVEECLENTLQLAKSVVKARKIKKLFAGTPPISCSPSQINQVLLNLITNAVQATADNDGAITVVTRMHGRDHVAVDVIDNGIGIAETVMPKIFDPFFTTKEVGKGTGLGLAIAYKIVQQHGGAIKVHSKEGRGTKFTVTLPVKGADKRMGETAQSPGAEPMAIAA